MRSRSLCIAALGAALAPPPAAAGEYATSDSGERVMLNDDGTWEAVSSSTGAGDCGALLKPDIHPGTGQPTSATSAPIRLAADSLTGLELTAFAEPTSRVLTVNLLTYGLKYACVRDDSVAELTLADGRRLSVSNGVPTNCDGAWTAALTYQHEAVLALADQDLQSLILQTQKEAMAVTAPPEQAARLRQTFACLTRP